MAEGRHPNSGDLYTPMTEEVRALLQSMHDEIGSWAKVAAASSMRMKMLRKVRFKNKAAISQRLLDRMILGTGVGSIDDFPWFTADDLVRLGIWKEPMRVEGRKRIQSGVTTVVDEHGRLGEREKARRRKQRRRSRFWWTRKNEFGIRLRRPK